MTLKPPRASVSIKLVGECWASKGVIGRARCERQEAGATGASLRLAGTPHICTREVFLRYYACNLFLDIYTGSSRIL